MQQNAAPWSWGGWVGTRRGQLLGIDAVRESVADQHAESADEIRDAIFALTASRRVDDDATVLVFRYSGLAA